MLAFAERISSGARDVQCRRPKERQLCKNFEKQCTLINWCAGFSHGLKGKLVVLVTSGCQGNRVLSTQHTCNLTEWRAMPDGWIWKRSEEKRFQMFSHTGNQPLLHPGLTICVRSQKGEEGIGLANLVVQHDLY